MSLASENMDSIRQAKGELGQAPVPNPILETNMSLAIYNPKVLIGFLKVKRQNFVSMEILRSND